MEKEPTFREEELKSGYSREDAYFDKVNQELIRKIRKDQDQKRNDKKRVAQHPHWMKCPNCGTPLVEVSLKEVKGDRCPHCQGIFFDHGELEIMLESLKSNDYLETLRSILKSSI